MALLRFFLYRFQGRGLWIEPNGNVTLHNFVSFAGGE